MRNLSSRLLILAVAILALAPASAFAHGADIELYDVVIEKVTPAGLPLDLRVQDGDEMRIENVGSKEFLLCGYPHDRCEPYAKINSEGVFMNHNSEAYFANLDEEQWGEVPEDAGVGAPEWEKVRSEPAFFTYHDHRIHWMGPPGSLPPGVDPRDPAVQKVNDFTIQFTYDGEPGEISGRLNYIGGRTFLQQWGETMVAGFLIFGMVVVFIIDKQRRAKQRAAIA